MAVIESGLIVNGIPLIRSEYYEMPNSVDPFIKIGLFTAIQSFASQAFKDETEEMRFKKFVILLKDLNPGAKDPIILYSIVEKNTDIPEVKKRLNILEKMLPLRDLPLDTPIMTEEILDIKNQINLELKDLILRPADRAKIIFD